jgi:hypothetical protein
MERLDPTDFQVAVARTFFELKASQGYVVAGGAGLLASELINRPTEDLDLFASAPADSVTASRNSFIKALDRRGWDHSLLVDSPTFCRMVVRDGRDEVLVDLALDSPPATTPTMTVLGPTLAPLELAGRKLLALFGRAEARDFADVYVLVERFGQNALLEQAETLDAGFDRSVLGQMMRTLDRFDDDEIPLPRGRTGAARQFFAEWAAELS